MLTADASMSRNTLSGSDISMPHLDSMLSINTLHVLPAVLDVMVVALLGSTSAVPASQWQPLSAAVFYSIHLMHRSTWLC